MPVVERRPGEHHGVLVGPLGGVPPPALPQVPVVAPGRVAHYPVGETVPHYEGEVNLQPPPQTDKKGEQRQSQFRSSGKYNAHEMYVCAGLAND